MLTLHSSFREIVGRADYRSSILVELTDGVWSYKASKGNNGLGYPEGLLQVEPMPVEFDPVTRKPKGSAIQLHFDDDWIRPIIANVFIKHQKCIISVGGPGVTEGNYVGVFAGPIEEIAPSNGEIVTLEVEDVFTVLQKTKIVGWWNDHPLEIIKDILLNKVGLAAAMVDEPSLTKTNYAGIGHLMATRGLGMTPFRRQTAILEPTPAFEVIDSLCQLLNGQLIPNESGALTFKKFDSTASIQRTWGVDEIKADSFEQLSDESRIVNRVICDFAYDLEGEPRLSYQADETVSQAALAYPGMGDRVLSERIQTRWLDYGGTLEVALGGGAGDLTASIAGPMFAWAGSRKELGVAQPVNTNCTAARAVYLMLAGSDQEPEIIKATSIVFTASGGGIGSTAYDVVDPETGVQSDVAEYHDFGQYTIARAQFGTTRQAWGRDYVSTMVYDVTPLVILAEELLDRLVDEMHVVRFETAWDQLEVQLFDFVGFNWPDFLAFGFDGMTGGNKWEVVGKEIVDDEEPRFRWTLAYAGVAGATWAASIPGVLWASDAEAAAANEDEGANVVASIAEGFDLSDDGGRNATVGTGGAATSGRTVLYRKTNQKTYEANQTTYIYWNTHVQQVGYWVAPAEPAWLTNMIPLHSVTTNGADITGQEDLRIGTSLPGGKVHDSTISAKELLGDTLGSKALNLNKSFTMR